MKRCSISDCEGLAYERGMCLKHYMRWLDEGTIHEDRRIGSRTQTEKIPQAVARGLARAASLTPSKRSESARRASQIRWARRGEPRTPQHGTPNEYNKYKCRCDLCRKAWSEYQAEKNKVPCSAGCGILVWGHNRTRTGMCRKCLAITKTKPIQHGTESGYGKGCKCEFCRGAASSARRQRRIKEAREALAR